MSIPCFLPVPPGGILAGAGSLRGRVISTFLSTGSDSSVVLPVFPLRIAFGRGGTKRCPKNPRVSDMVLSASLL